jgi:hypothetical protein
VFLSIDLLSFLSKGEYGDWSSFGGDDKTSLPRCNPKCGGDLLSNFIMATGEWAGTNNLDLSTVHDLYQLDSGYAPIAADAKGLSGKQGG